MNLKKGIILTFFLYLTLGCYAQDFQKPIISVLTCAPGVEVYSMYGHNAIRIRYNDNNDLVFNYGTFDFNTPNFTLKFMRGKLPYHLTVNHFQDFLYEYNATRRGVIEQVIQLDTIQTERLVRFLENNAKPENREYKYDFFYDNCATRIYDVLLYATGNQIVWPKERTNGNTFRDIIKFYQRGFPWTDFGIDLLIGSRADEVALISEEMFIPDFVQSHLSEASVQSNNFVASSEEVLSFERPKYSAIKIFFLGPVFFFLCILCFELFFFYFLVIKKKSIKLIKKIDNIWFLFLSLISLAVIFMWFFTDHVPTRDNWNLLWTLPAFLYFIPKVHGNKTLLIVIGVILTLTILNSFGMPLLPQYFHPAFGIIGAISLLKWLRFHFVYTRQSVNKMKGTS